MNNKINTISKLFLIVGILIGLSGCTAKASNSITEETSISENAQENKQENNSEQEVNYSSIDFKDKIELKYAKKFKVNCSDGYKLVTINEDEKYLIVEEGSVMPVNIPDDIVVIQQPINSTYLVSSSVMDLLDKINCISYVSLSGLKEDGWYIDKIKEAMSNGDIEYAGKYNSPDYELILNKKCDLAIENTMIYHNPEVKEKLEELNIPVIVEYSSYEEHPLGRLEWIKLYGIIFGTYDLAEQFFNEQIDLVENSVKLENTGLKVAFFYINGNGVVNVRKPNDYIAKMIGLAGAEYIIKENAEENALSTMNMQMEDFYAAAKDADVIIYNSTIDGELESINDLIEKNDLFRDFKAVKENRVYCTGKNLFQETTCIGNFIIELNQVFVSDSDLKLKYIHKIN